MKKNLVTRHNLEAYKFKFLPFLESKFTLDYYKDKDLVLNQSSLADYFGLDRRIIADFLKQAENDGLIKFDKKVRKIDGDKVDWALNRYRLILDEDCDSKCFSMLQKYINTYMYWFPDFGDRCNIVSGYYDTLEHQATSKNLEKAEKANAYLASCSWTEEMQKKINETRPEKLKSKYLADGKLRENNFLCQTLNPEKEHVAKIDVADLSYRYTILTNFFGTDNFVERDTNGSIYRLTYNLNHKNPLAHSVDVYYEFWKEAGFKAEFTKQNRDNLKLLCMPIFMSNGAKNGYNALMVYKNDLSLDKKDYAKKCALLNVCRDTGLEARQVLDALTAAMYKVLGTDHFLEEEIFIHESNLHLMILGYCADHDIRAINVYDGFYFIDGTMTKEEFYDLYDDCTKQIKSKKYSFN